MTYLPKPTGGGDFAPPPAGSLPAICYRFLDLGTQEKSFKGESKSLHQIMLSFEIKDEDAVMEDGRPMTIHARYTWSMHEKATLRQVLESWRGKKFQDSDFGEGGFDVRKLLGVPCLLTVVHTEKDGKVYANIKAISKLPKGLTVGTLHNPKQFLWLSREEFDPDVFNALSEGLQNTIRKAPEYHDLKDGSGNEYAAATGKSLDEEIPF